MKQFVTCGERLVELLAAYGVDTVFGIPGIQLDPLYDAMYAQRNQLGSVELRGLENQEYKIVDYVNDKDYGIVTGPDPKLDVTFEKNLLLMAIPQ